MHDSLNYNNDRRMQKGLQVVIIVLLLTLIGLMAKRGLNNDSLNRAQSTVLSSFMGAMVWGQFVAEI